MDTLIAEPFVTMVMMNKLSETLQLVYNQKHQFPQEFNLENRRVVP